MLLPNSSSVITFLKNVVAENEHVLGTCYYGGFLHIELDPHIQYDIVLAPIEGN